MTTFFFFFFFWKFCFSLRTSYEELIWYTNNLISNIRTFCKHWNFIWRYIFPVSILKKGFFCARVFRFISGLSIKAWKSYWFWLGGLYRVIKLQILFPIIFSKFIHSDHSRVKDDLGHVVVISFNRSIFVKGNQYLDIKNYILKTEWRHVSLYTSNIFWSIS